MRYVWLPVALTVLSVFSFAQDNNTAKGCMEVSQDRAIHLCDPPGTTLPLRTHMRAYAASSSTVTSFQLWMDGVKKFESASLPCCDRATMEAMVQPSSPGWHRFVFIAKDAVGEFRRTAYYYLTSTQACFASSNREFKICNGLKDGDVVRSPLHIVAATRETTIPIYLMQVLAGDSNSDFIPVNVLSVATNSTTHQLALSGYVHLKPGTHTLRFNANGQGDLTWDKEITVTVLE